MSHTLEVMRDKTAGILSGIVKTKGRLLLEWNLRIVVNTTLSLAPETTTTAESIITLSLSSDYTNERNLALPSSSRIIKKIHSWFSDQCDHMSGSQLFT